MGSRAAPNRCARPADAAFPNERLERQVVVFGDLAEKYNRREVHSRMSALTRVLAAGGARALALRGRGRASPVLTGRRYSSNPMEDFDLMGAGGSSVIDTYTERGFVVGGVEHRGSVFLYQDMTLLWKVKDIAEVTQASLTAAHALRPPPDLLIVGCGARIGALPRETAEFFRDGETAVEVLDTPNAVATYNILVQEGRSVAAAMILPRTEG